VPRHAPARRRDLAAQLRVRELVRGEACERTLAVQRLPQRDAERELIRGRTEPIADVLLGCHVGGRAEHETVLGEPHVGAPRSRSVGGIGPREAEVQDARAAVLADDHILRLEVPVDDPLAMSGQQAASRLREHADDLRPPMRRLAQPAIEAEPPHEFQRDVNIAAVRVDVVDRHDVRVLQSCQRLRLTDEPRARPVARSRAQELERDHAVQTGIVRTHDDPHRTLARRAEHHVPPDPVGGKGASKGGGGCHHCTGDPARK
jgi:hypothetical protein